MVVKLRLWVKPTSLKPHCNVFWAGMDNKWDANDFYRGQSQGVQTRLERIVCRFAESGILASKHGHRRKGKKPYNELYEFKDNPSGVRMMAFNLKHLLQERLGNYVIVLCVSKQKDDITKEEEEKAVRRMEDVKKAALDGTLEIIGQWEQSQ